MNRLQQVRAVLAHEIPDRPPLQVAPGDEVAVGERDSEWPEFVFVWTDDGQGWIPARLVSGPGPKAIILAEYDTTELPTREGEELLVVRRDDLGGWHWCRNAAGEEGWVPVRTLAAVDIS